jgi:hypothetical protein
MALSAMLALWLAVSGQLALAQGTPPPPNATPQSVTTNEDTLKSIDTGVPFDNRYQIVIIAPGPAHGTIAQSGAAPGNFKIDYTPGANQTSPVSFVYQFCTVATPLVCAQSATVTINITPVNDGPQAGADNKTTTYGQSILIDVLANDNGGANEFDSISLVAGSVTAPSSPAPADGTAVIEGNQIRYTAPTEVAAGAVCPAPGALVVTFTYQIVDNTNGQMATGTVTINVTCPQLPVISLSKPYNAGNHKFKVDVILTSPNVEVTAIDVDVDLSGNACLVEPDLPTDNKLADDVTTTLPSGSFQFGVQDTAAKKVRIFAAATLPDTFLAGPAPASSPRTIATIELRANGQCADQTAILTPTSITGKDGIGIAGNVQNNITAPMPTTAQLNKAPTDISLSNLVVNEFSNVASAFIGMLTTTDADAGDTFTYAVVPVVPPIPPSPATFTTNPAHPDELNINGPAQSGLYRIKVTVTDKFGQSYSENFDITVADVNKAPKANNDGSAAAPLPVFGPSDVDVLANDTDGDDYPSPGLVSCATLAAPDNKCSVVSVTNGSKGIVVNQGTKVRYIPTDPNHYSIDPAIAVTDIFAYVITDNDAPNALTSQANVTVKIYPEVYTAGPAIGQVVKLGDCNRSGTVEAGDLTATGLEIFDGDGNLWYDIYKGSRTAFSPRGCNSNQDRVLDAGDISCTARKIFNAAANCGAAMAASASKATLEVASGLRGAAGSTVSVPVSLRNNGNAVDTAVFALAYDASKLSFNADDASAISLSDGQLAMVNAVDGRVEIVVTGLSAADGAVANISLSVKESASGDAAVSLADSSLGSEGGTVAVDTADGAIQIGDAGALRFRALLPFISK